LSVGFTGNDPVELDDHVTRFERATVPHLDPIVELGHGSWAYDLDDLVSSLQRCEALRLGLVRPPSRRLTRRLQPI
jgi:hypothetical protein